MHSVEIKNLTKVYGEQKALDNVNLSIGKGEVVGLLGPNGAGKSTLMKIITAYIPATSGKVFVDGKDVDEEQLNIRQNLGYLPENNPLYTDMYVKEYLSFVLNMYKTNYSTSKRVNEMIELTGLGPEMKKKIGALSKGYRQRVGLAQALIHDPDLLILDEPTSGLDPNQLVDIRNIISKLGESKTIILSTHIMQEVEAVCNRVVIINHGNIVADDSTSQLSELAGSAAAFIVEFKESVGSALLKKIKHVDKYENIGGNTWRFHCKSGIDIREAIFKFAVDNSLSVLSLEKSKSSMEEIFHNLTL